MKLRYWNGFPWAGVHPLRCWRRGDVAIRGQGIGVALVVLALGLCPSMQLGGAEGPRSTRVEPERRRALNPALVYWQAFAVLPRLSEAESGAVTRSVTNAAVADAERQLASRFAPSLRLVRRAALETADCDWGVDYAEGPATVLPSLARFRDASLGSLLAARVALAEGRRGEAVADLEAAWVLGRRVALDGTLAHVVIQQGAERRWLEWVASEVGALGAEGRLTLERALSGVPRRVTVAEAMAREREAYWGWITRRLEEGRRAGGPEAEGVERWLQAVGVSGKAEGEAEIISAIGGQWERAATLLAQVRRGYDLAEAVARAERAGIADAMGRFESFRSEARNPLMGMVPVAVESARRRELDLDDRVAMVRAVLARGEDPGIPGGSLPDPRGGGAFLVEPLPAGGDEGFLLRREPAGTGGADETTRVVLRVITRRAAAGR